MNFAARNRKLFSSHGNTISHTPTTSPAVGGIRTYVAVRAVVAEGRTKTYPRLHFLHPLRSRHEGCLETRILRKGAAVEAGESFFFAVVAVCAFVVSCKKDLAPSPDAWAVVNGKEITRADVEKAYRSRVNADAPNPSQEEALSLKN